MLTTLHPSSPTPDQAVRDLLDRRARASHTRYPSVSYSQRSDSPSIYSRGDYSPNTQTHFRGRQWLHSGYQMSLSGQGRLSYDDDDNDDDDDAITTFTRTSFDQDDQSIFPPADDDISIISAITPRLPVPVCPEPSAACGQDAVAESPPTEEMEEDARMSMLGPKMRFVSKAPWELGENDVLEEEEEPISATDALSAFSTKMSSWRSKDQDKSSAKGLGLSATRSRSPGSLPASIRKGNSGVNPGLYRHQHQESQREGPYGPHLSGASQSHGTIPNALTSSSRSLHSVTNSLSSDYVAHKQPRGRANVASPVEPFPSPTHPFLPQNVSLSSRGGSIASFRSESPPSDRYIHPYANPDLLQTAPSVSSAPPPRTPRVSQDRMSDEKEQQNSPLRRASESATSSPQRGTGLRKVSAGALPLPAMPFRNAFGEHHEFDEMSQPVSRPRARTPSKPVPLSPVRSITPYGDQPGSPMHSLITLEQARARVQNTNRGQGLSDTNGSSTASTAGSTPSSTLVAGIGLAPGVVVDDSVIRGQMQRANPPSAPSSDISSWSGMTEQKQISHPRPRTTSSGKHMFGNSSGAGADGDPVTGKTVKHKKSAFMKLFQGKDKEREGDHKDTTSSFSDYPVRAMSTPPQLPPSDSPAPPLPSSSIHNIKRIPPPLPLSVVVTSPSFPSSDRPPHSDQERPSTRPASPPRLRQASAPFLSSSYGSSHSSTQGQRLATSESQPPSSSGLDVSKPASSAPCTHTTFETLSLRPVSTVFSAKFPDLLSHSSPPDTTSSATLKRLDYPSPATSCFSDSRSTSLSTASDFPLTPTSGYVAGPSSHGVVPGEDQSTIITSLQEQIVNSRKMWQRQIWELEGQVKDLKAEVEELRNAGECEICGMAKGERRVRAPVQNVGVVDRPRPRLGGGNTRTVFGGGCDM